MALRDIAFANLCYNDEASYEDVVYIIENSTPKLTYTTFLFLYRTMGIVQFNSLLRPPGAALVFGEVIHWFPVWVVKTTFMCDDPHLRDTVVDIAEGKYGVNAFGRNKMALHALVYFYRYSLEVEVPSF